MPAQSSADQPHHVQPASGSEPGLVSPLSRRSLLRGAAGAGAVGFAAAAGAGAVFAATRPAGAAKPAETGNTATLDAVTNRASDEPLVVYLRDVKSGEFEIFNGSNAVTVRNPGLAAELFSSLQTAL
jgi:hypothetical protein